MEWSGWLVFGFIFRYPGDMENCSRGTDGVCRVHWVAVTGLYFLSLVYSCSRESVLGCFINVFFFSFLIYSSHSLTRVGEGSRCNNSLGDNGFGFSFRFR